MITSDNLFVEKLNRLIDDNLDNSSFSIDTICQTLGMSRSQLHRIIKEQTELSTTLYIRKRRLLLARQLLITTELRVSEIGDTVGIINPQNFSTYFIDEFKVSPTDFRKLNSRPSVVSEPLPELETVPDVMPLPHPNQLIENQPTQSRFLNRRRLIYVVASAGLMLVVSAGLHLWLQSKSTNRPALPIGHSLAVLPFSD